MGDNSTLQQSQKVTGYSNKYTSFSLIFNIQTSELGFKYGIDRFIRHCKYG
jgi:hypothetical protein